MAESAGTRTLVVANVAGLHARAASLIATTCRRFDAKVLVTKGVEQVEATDVLQLMCLAAAQGDSLLVEAAGPEAPQALEALEDLFRRKFDEDEFAVG
jgi:phosphocarrier protein